MEKKIITVCGPIKPEELGFTSMHDHVLCNSEMARDRYAPFLEPDEPVGEEDPVSLENLGFLKHALILSKDVLRMVDVEIMSKETSYFKASGGSAIVEMSTPGIRCDVNGLRSVSQNSGVHIIAPTGIYAYDSWPERFKEMDVQELTAYMLDEVENGIEGTDIFPGHIKVAADVSDQPQELNAIKAAARVSVESGLLMTVHQGMYLSEEQGTIIANIIQKEGADLFRTVMAHCSKFFVDSNLDKAILEPESWKLNTDHVKTLLDRGLNFSIDLFGHTWDAELLAWINPTDWQQMAGLVALIKAGYSSQIVLGTDTFIKTLLRSYGGEGYCRLTDYVVPTLTRIGISDTDIRAITVDNPRRLLSV